MELYLSIINIELRYFNYVIALHEYLIHYNNKKLLLLINPLS